MTYLAATLGLTIIEERGAHAGGFRPGEATIRLLPGLTARDRRSVLAHEIGHYVLGHVPCPAGILHARQERSASEWAADRLISLAAYRDAENVREGHLESIAHDLDVHPKIAAVYRDMLARIGDAVYLRPRMGLGQWDHKSAA